MRNGSHNSTAYRADHLTPVRPIGDGVKKKTDCSPTTCQQIKKGHHKKQRAWDKKLIKEEV